MSLTDKRDELAEQARKIALQNARTLYGVLRSQQITAERAMPDVDSNYYYRQCLLLSAKLTKAIVAFRDVKDCGGKNQNQHFGRCTKIIDRILKEIE